MKILNNLITYDVNFEVIISSIISHIIEHNIISLLDFNKFINDLYQMIKFYNKFLNKPNALTRISLRLRFVQQTKFANLIENANKVYIILLSNTKKYKYDNKFIIFI